MIWLWVYLRGMMMGAADIVPGVSGGTIAFVTGIYERLLAAISSFVPAFFSLVKHRSAKRFSADTDLIFVLVLLFGILSSVFLFASLISFALEAQPIQIWSFFSGLIVASAILIGLEVKEWSLSRFMMLVAGVIFAVLLGSSSFFYPSSLVNWCLSLWRDRYLCDDPARYFRKLFVITDWNL